MVIGTNNKKNVDNSKNKKENNKDDVVDSTKSNKKNVDNSKNKKENNKDDVVDSTKKDSISLSSSILAELDDNKEKEQLSYYEKQVLKELKGIKKTSKNILKSLKKFSS